MSESGRAPSGQALAVPATPANAVDGPSGFDPSRGFLLRPFVVAVDGFGEFAYPAESRGKALAEAWQSYTSCYDAATFGDFLKIARVKLVDPPPRFGEPITVGGQPAFYVGERGQYIRFAHPGSAVTHLAHPADVAAIAMSASGQDPQGLEAKPASATAESGDAQ